MKKVAIVGVEGSGKTVMLAGLGDLYTYPDEEGYFLAPKNFGTAAYVADKIERMRKGEWPTATAGDEMQGLDWTLKRRKMGTKGYPDTICEVSFLDFAGEVYRAAYGVSSAGDAALKEQVEALKQYVRGADDLIVLINLRDVITNGLRDKRVQEAMWITNAILESALGGDGARRAAIVLSQADSYAETIKACDGAAGVLQKYLPHVANNYGWLDIFAANAVDKTVLDDDGNVVPASDFKSEGLRSAVRWILGGIVADADEMEEELDEEKEDDAEASEDEKTMVDYVPRDAEKCKSWEFIRAAAEEIDGCDAYPHVLLGEGNLIDWSLSTGSSALLLEVLPFSCDYDVVDDDVEPAAEEVSMSFVTKLLRGKEFLAREASGTPVTLGVFASPTTIKAIRSRISEPRYRNKFKDAHLEYLTCANFTAQVKRILDGPQTDARTEPQSSGSSLYELAENYYHGQNGVKEDRAKAFELYQKAAEQGHAEAQYSLGYMYANGESVVKDNDKAVLWYGKAAAQGHQKAARFLSGLKAKIVKEQEEERTKAYWRKKEEERRLNEAQSPVEKERQDTEEKMAQAYRSYEEGNYSAAASLWRTCAVRGVAAAQHNLGALYATGQGVEQDYAQAIEWLQKGAAQGDESSQKLLDAIYAKLAQEKQRLQKEKARLEQQKASALDERHRLLQEKGALLNKLGVSFYTGSRGQVQDYAKAVEHFKKAAEIGNVSAQYNLGVCYASGNGVQKNVAEAIRWYRKAAENGHATAKEELRNLGVK